MPGRCDLSQQERDAIRREFMLRFSSARSVHDGFLVKRWATGERKGQPKIAAALQGMIDRGYLRVEDDGGLWLKATFTPAGFEQLRLMAQDPRALPRAQFGQLLDELAALDMAG